jgi:transposase InsO family protein
MQYIAQGMKRDTALTISGVSKHQYYHRKKSRVKSQVGRPESTFTTNKEGLPIPNQTVVEEIKKTKACQDTNYGYRNMTYHLMLLGYIINKKKVYRLMKQASLLRGKVKSQDKKYIKYRVVAPEGPLQVFGMDIKMVWIAEHRRHAYILNIIDTFTRSVLYWSVGYQMKQQQIKQAWEFIIVRFLQQADCLKKQFHIEVRNDNGPQFIAKMTRDFFTENHINQVFTHPYTPQENGHVESFHAILKNALGQQPFWSLQELEKRLEMFYYNYNHNRIHGSIANLPPKLFWACWEEQLIERTVMDKLKVKFRLKMPYQDISGNESLREVLCSIEQTLDGFGQLEERKEVNGANTPNLQPSV